MESLLHWITHDRITVSFNNFHVVLHYSLRAVTYKDGHMPYATSALPTQHSHWRSLVWRYRVRYKVSNGFLVQNGGYNDFSSDYTDAEACVEPHLANMS
ncbi:hypothetical protein DPMN_060404 [Dreissena polymorpha]|uniref:Uncharacterized protein n=1 Tax=Dreissena polymorpha TaxID=45954 RepID=A0A9D4C559_DREPO|nr:hypothetical protein DPMN_060404 [Dreissena polymorpha]